MGSPTSKDMMKPRSFQCNWTHRITPCDVISLLKVHWFCCTSKSKYCVCLWRSISWLVTGLDLLWNLAPALSRGRLPKVLHFPWSCTTQQQTMTCWSTNTLHSSAWCGPLRQARQKTSRHGCGWWLRLLALWVMVSIFGQSCHRTMTWLPRISCPASTLMK